MSQDDHNTTGFFNKLSGKATADDVTDKDRGVVMLRKALQNQLETIRQAEAAKGEALSGEELAKMNALKQDLIAKGLIGGSVHKQTLTDWLEKIREFIFGTGWERPIALAASILFAIALILQINVPSDLDTDVVRGGEDTPILVVADPVATIELLTKQLTQAGAEVLPVPINDNEWTVQVDVPSKVDVTVIQKLLSTHGVQVTGLPPYHLYIKRKP